MLTFDSHKLQWFNSYALNAFIDLSNMELKKNLVTLETVDIIACQTKWGDTNI